MMQTRLTVWERAAIPAMVSLVPSIYQQYITFEGWCDRVRETPLTRGMRVDVLQHAFALWRAIK